MTRPPAALLAASAIAVAAATGWWLAVLATDPAARAQPPPAALVHLVDRETKLRPQPAAESARLPKLERHDDGLADAELYATIADPAASDLPPTLFRRLTALAADIVTADTTGAGRHRWPHYWNADNGLRSEACCTRITIHAAGAASHPHQHNTVLARVLWSAPHGKRHRSQLTTVELGSHDGLWRPRRP